MTQGDIDAPTADSVAHDVEVQGSLVPEPAGPGPDPASAEEPAPDPSPEVDLAVIAEQLAALIAETARSSSHADAREQVIVHQRDQLDALRAERAGTHLRPLVVGLAKLRAELVASAAGSDDQRLRGDFEYYADSIEAVLERCGVERLPLGPGDAFEPAEHSAVRSADVEPERHRTVVTVLADGWRERDSGRVLAPAKVVVGRHLPLPTPHENEETSDV